MLPVVQVLLSEDGGETEFLALAVSDRKEAVKKLEKEQGMHTHTKAALKNAETQVRRRGVLPGHARVMRCGDGVLHCAPSQY